MAGPEYYPPPELYQPNGPVQPQPQEDPQEPQQPMTPERRILIIVSFLLIVVSAAFLIRGLVFSIRSVKVIGLHKISWQEVARSAGITSSSNYFALDEKRIRDGINANRYLVYERMQRVRRACWCCMSGSAGRSPASLYRDRYIMADDGVILERSRELSDYSGLIPSLALRSGTSGREGIMSTALASWRPASSLLGNCTCRALAMRCSMSTCRR